MMALYSELHRPQFHFSSRENWINDPNGLVYKEGVWHLFFQHNPEATTWGTMTWGHAVSEDLIHWRQLANALYPDEHGTMFSGSAVVDHGNSAGFGEGALLAFYTAAGGYVKPKRAFTQCLAYSVDNGERWSKYAGNPIIDCIEEGNRDPKVVWHPGTRQWIMALYLAEDRYCLLNSPDALHWSRFQALRLEGVRECPDFFPLEDESGAERWVFWGARGVYLVGSFDGERFTPETGPQICEHGGNGYAAQTWSDAPDGRRVQISWMAGGLYPEMPFNQQMSIPVELRLVGMREQVALARWPVTELDALRKKTIHLARQAITGEHPLVAQTKAKLLDLSFTVKRQTAEALYVMIRGQYIEFDWSSNELGFKAGASYQAMPGRTHVPLPGGPALSVRLVIDRTSVELFINEGRVSASFCFLPGGYIHPLELRSRGGEQVIDHFELHEIASIWPGAERNG